MSGEAGEISLSSPGVTPCLSASLPSGELHPVKFTPSPQTSPELHLP